MPPKLTQEQFLKKALEIHKEKYDYSNAFYKTGHDKILIKCNICHLEFNQLAYHHLAGHGCPKCGNALLSSKEEFVIKAKEIHKNLYDYTNTIYVNSATKLEILCKKCNNIFLQIPHSHLKGEGCRKCGREIGIIKRTYSKEEFLQRCFNVHGEKFNYFNIEYKNLNSKIVIKCNICENTFEQLPQNHLQGQGCPKCKAIKLNKELKYLLEEVKEICKSNNFEFLDEIYVNNRTKHKVRCLVCNHKWGVILGSVSRGHRCPRCSKNSISLAEIKWLDGLNIPENHRQTRLFIANKHYKVDAFDPDTNTIYEFFGDYWHGNPTRYSANEINPSNKRTFGELYKETLERINIFEQSGYKVIYIWEGNFL